MVQLSSRTQISIIDPEKVGENAIIRAGDIEINLLQFERKINGRRNERISWSHVYSSLVECSSINDQMLTKRQFFDAMMPTFKEILGGGSIGSQSTKLNFDYPAPCAGYAEAICKYFDLNNTSPRLADFLKTTEEQSIALGEENKAKSQSSESQMRTENEQSDNSRNDAVQGPSKPLNDDAQFILAARAQEAAERATDLDRMDATFVHSGGTEHRAAHRTAAEIAASGQRTNPYALILGTVDRARGSLGWRTREEAQEKRASETFPDR